MSASSMRSIVAALTVANLFCASLSGFAEDCNRFYCKNHVMSIDWVQG